MNIYECIWVYIIAQQPSKGWYRQPWMVNLFMKLFFQIMDCGMDFKYLNDIVVYSKTFMERLDTTKMVPWDRPSPAKSDKKLTSPAKKQD